MKPTIYAHRGASGMYPENTLSAFRAAINQGADGIELDVQLTRDGEVIVMHDHTLERTTTGSGLIHHHTYSQIRRLQAGIWFDPRFPKTKVPKLEHVLAMMKPTNLRIIIEYKNFTVPQPQLEEKVIQLIHAYQLQKRVTISSFNFNSLLRTKELAPHIETALLYFGSLHEPWRIAKEYQADLLHASKEVITPSLLYESHKHNFPVIAWTINSRIEMKQLISLGIDGIITNFPLRAKKILRKPD